MKQAVPSVMSVYLIGEEEAGILDDLVGGLCEDGLVDLAELLSAHQVPQGAAPEGGGGRGGRPSNVAHLEDAEQETGLEKKHLTQPHSQNAYSKFE